jgi:hypothetical protein
MHIENVVPFAVLVVMSIIFLFICIDDVVNILYTRKHGTQIFTEIIKVKHIKRGRYSTDRVYVNLMNEKGKYEEVYIEIEAGHFLEEQIKVAYMPKKPKRAIAIDISDCTLGGYGIAAAVSLLVVVLYSELH